MRRPSAVLRVAGGARLRDLILREDLRVAGLPISVERARGLGDAHLSVPLVLRLRRTFPTPPGTLIDVGAAHGRFARAADLAFPGIRIHAFEPLAEVFRTLERSLAPLPAARAHRLALGAGAGVGRIHRSRNTGSSSLRPMLPAHTVAFPGTDMEDSESVPVGCLDDLVESKEVRLEPPVLLKIDVQGYEDQVIAGAGRALDQIDAVIVETSLVPLYEGQALAPEISDILTAKGFRARDPFDEIRSVTGKTVQIDALFTRSTA